MNILITGATGFIGSHLVKQLLSAGHGVTAIVRPKSNIESLDQGAQTFVYNSDIYALIDILKRGQFDGVIHLAAHCPTGHHREDLADLIDANIRFGAEIIEAAAEAGIKWFINTGSYMQHYDDREYSPSILYAATKQAFLDIARYWSDSGKISVVTLELFDNFGIGDKRKKIFTAWRDAFKTKELVSMSPGYQTMDVSPVENVAAAFAHIASLLYRDKEHKLNGQIFSLYSDNRMTLREWAKLFQRVSGEHLNLNWDGRPYRDREIMEPWTKGIRIPGFQPVIEIEDAIKKYLDYE